MENVATNVLSNSTSVIAIVIGAVIIVGIISWLVNKGKLIKLFLHFKLVFLLKL